VRRGRPWRQDYVENDGERINKPFVEKPADSENHNLCIYYPHTVGGGYKALFRKVGNQASRYYPPPRADSGTKPYSLVRRDMSFIYEDFMSTGGRSPQGPAEGLALLGHYQLN
jgi:inositol hexakisphosphate/diphosphoinositol-pentakisphosphate kinase